MGAFKKLNETKSPGYPSPIYGYKFKRVKFLLDKMKENDSDPFDGYAIEYINPLTEGSADSRIGTMMQKLKPGMQTMAHRHVHSAIYHVLEGNGYTVIDGQKFEWEKGDFFILPPWSFHEHVNTGEEDVYLFSFNDKPVMEKLELEYSEPFKENDGHQIIEKVFVPDNEEGDY